MSRTRSPRSPRTLTLLLALGAASCARSAPPPATPRPAGDAAAAPAKDPQAAKAAIAAGAVVLDVRTPDEYAEDHLPDAVNVPLQELARRMADVDALVAGDKARPVVVYCSSGRRAGQAKLALEAAGYARVVNGGGLDDLR